MNRRRFFVGLAALAVLVVIGVGGYLIGHSTGKDLDAARAQGEAEGQKAGAAEGAAAGYKAALGPGRREGFEQSYPPAYKAAYRSAYEDTGAGTAPDQISVELP